MTPPRRHELWVSDDGMLLVRVGPTYVEVCTREDPDALWGPPVRLAREV